MKESLSLAEEMNSPFIIGILLGMLAIYYWHKGDIETTYNYYERSKESLEKSKNTKHWHYSELLYRLAMVSLEMGDLKRALENRDKLEKIKNQHTELHQSHGMFKLVKALIIKYQLAQGIDVDSSKKLEAEKILQNLSFRKFTFADVNKIAMFHLCDLYVKEYHASKDQSNIDKLKETIHRFTKLAEEQKSSILLAEVYLFESQLALVENNTQKARNLMNKAQKIADDHGLHLWARKISYEHDKLLVQLDEWESLKKRNIPMTDRLDLISIEKTVDIILQKRGIRPPELTDEIPMLFLIIAEGGIPIYSKSFIEEKDFKETFISKFLTAFNTFSEQIFSEGLDRATFGNYTLVMAPVNSFSLCYLFKGQSYVAKQKLTRFTEKIRKNKLLGQIFENFDQNNETIKLSENAPLESLITEIFISKTIQITEKEVVIQKEKKICLVCKGEVVKFFYVCECGAIYCENCARAISDLENLCWACNVPIDYSRPVKSIEKVVKGDIKKSP